jgi:hypothetical protein
MKCALRILGQALAFGLVAAFLGYFSQSPAYTHLDPGLALLKVSFTHGAPRQAACRQRTPEELAKLPPNMRRPLDCPRVRPSVAIELVLDGKTLLDAELAPTGLSGDGPSRLYHTFAVPPGPHRLEARLRDSVRVDGGWDHERLATIELAAGQNFVLDFRPDAGGFVFR